MPLKKDSAASAAVESEGIAAFDLKDTKLLAAAFVASVGIDKYDFELMASLSGYTASTVKKFWLQTKAKVMEAHPSFSTFLGHVGSGTTRDGSKTTPVKGNGRQKRKAADTEPDTEVDTDGKESVAETIKKPAAKPKGRSRKVMIEDSEIANGGEKVVRKGKDRVQGRVKAAATKAKAEDKVKDKAEDRVEDKAEDKTEDKTEDKNAAVDAPESMVVDDI